MIFTPSFNYSLSIPSGPTVSQQWTPKADAYARFSAVVPQGKKPTIEIAPTANTTLTVLTLSLAKPTDYSTKVTYNLGNGEWAFDAPQVIMGASVLTFINKALENLTITNGN